jgi:hypothetical protein
MPPHSEERRSMMANDEPCGWRSTFPVFYGTEAATIIERLQGFVRETSPQQYDAWRTHVPALQRECRELSERDSAAPGYSAILEYQLPYDLRRPDVIVLERAAVVVIEMKGHTGLSRAAFDQVIAYARDLRAYHRECAERPVVPVVITTGAPRPQATREGVRLCHPRDFDQVLSEIAIEHPGPALEPSAFLAEGTYVPLPTIVQAARQLFETRELPYIKRARAATEPALEHITSIAHQAASEGSRHLVLLSGVPGSGKTLVGLQLVHSRWLDDLAEVRSDGSKPTAAGVYLSGNGPLVRVLQDALKGGGGGGQTFVRPVKNYVEYYSKRERQTPSEHLLVYDEAQRAHDAEQVAYVHKKQIVGMSEPGHLLEFCTRVPRWNVLVALIGTGQAIHVGEEVGLPLWKTAVDDLPDARAWTVHCAPAHADIFRHSEFRLEVSTRLSLDVELRFHLTADVDEFVDGLVEDSDAAESRRLASEIWSNGHRLLVTRDLQSAKTYLQDRYGESPLARYGILASSKDKILPRFGVENSYQITKQLREGPWYNADPTDPRSCCQLSAVATEFASQGLELEFALLAWGSDLRREQGRWSDALSGGYQRKVRDRLALRRNVYRVLLTRGRDGTVVFVPPAPEMDETHRWLLDCGFRSLENVAPELGSPEAGNAQ